MADDETNLFQHALRGVRPLMQDKVSPHTERSSPIPRQTRKDEQQVINDLLSSDFQSLEVETGEELVHIRPGVQKSVFRRLRKGEYAISAELDLHGHTVDEARESLTLFLKMSQSSAHTCVRIVHGKGLRSPGKKPVLKYKIFHWLRQRDEVLALCSARPVDGGTGAVYVLLKKG